MSFTYIFIFGGAPEYLDGSGSSSYTFTAFIGLFVPFGPFNLMFSIWKGFFAITFPVFILTMIFIERYKKSSESGILKSILLNLATLFILTLVVDIIIWGQWNSWFILIGKDF